VGRKGGVDKCMQTAVQLQCVREHCQASGVSPRRAVSRTTQLSESHGAGHKTLTLTGLQCV
jgi:hypothetical protein